MREPFRGALAPSPDERHSPAGRELDHALIFVGQLLMDPARGLGGGGIGAASFGLLSMEEIIDVHVDLPPFVCSSHVLRGDGA